MIVNQRGRGMASRAPYTAPRPYRWRGTPGWDPANVVLSTHPHVGVSQEVLRQEAAERRAEFARLREAGVGVAEAGARLGVTRRTATKYEAARTGGAP